MIQRAFAICLISSGLNFALQGSSFSVRTKAKCSRPSIFAIHLKASADESRDKPEFPLDANLKKVEAEIEKVDRQITKIENEIEKAENQADEARSNGNDENEWKRLEKKTDYLRDEENQLLDKENKLKEERIILLKSIPNESFIDQDEKQKAIARGEAFVKAILADMEEIKVAQTSQTTENEKSYEVSGMQVLRDDCFRSTSTTTCIGLSKFLDCVRACPASISSSLISVDVCRRTNQQKRVIKVEETSDYRRATTS